MFSFTKYFEHYIGPESLASFGIAFILWALIQLWDTSSKHGRRIVLFIGKVTELISQYCSVTWTQPVATGQSTLSPMLRKNSSPSWNIFSAVYPCSTMASVGSITYGRGNENNNKCMVTRHSTGPTEGIVLYNSQFRPGMAPWINLRLCRHPSWR